MKHVQTKWVTGLAACLITFSTFSTVQAQQPKVVPQASELVRIKKLSALDRDCRQNSVGLGGKSAKAKVWGVFNVTFDTAPEWIDALSITYTVMLQNDKAKAGEKLFSLMQVTSIYPDLAMGRDHQAGAILVPAGFERYGRPIGFAVQMFVDGNLVAEEGLGEGSLKGVPKWWLNPTVMESPKMQKLNGYLVERSKSVFALVDLDSYEVSR